MVIKKPTGAGFFMIVASLFILILFRKSAQ
jgi:hypothetical protein